MGCTDILVMHHKTPRRSGRKDPTRGKKKNKVTGNGRTNHLAAKHFQIMLYIHTIGRIGKDCQVIEGTHGSFIAFDMAVDDFSHGNAVTTWVRVRSNKENHIRLSEYLTKGRMVLVGGTLSTSLWKDKNGDSQILSLIHI